MHSEPQQNVTPDLSFDDMKRGSNSYLKNYPKISGKPGREDER